MLWSLVKILAFVAFVIAATFGVTYLLEMDGGALVTIGGTEYQLSVLTLAIGFVLLVIAVWIGLWVLKFLVAVLKFINGDDTAISRYFSRNRERKGYDALAQGMIALASGDGNAAMTQATRADRYLGRPEISGLLTAQAAELKGDRKTAEETYKSLLAYDDTRFLGVRGIMKQKLEDGDTETALKLAQKAFELQPKHEDTQDVLLRLQAESSDWAGARTTLGQKLRQGSLPRDVYKRRDAVLAVSEAQEIVEDGSPVNAREAAIEANRLSPDLIPAAVLAARGYIDAGNVRYATRVLKKAWEVQPHPELAAVFAAIAPNESPTERLSRFTTITRQRPDHPETKMLLAELNIAAEDFPAAKRALGDLIETDPTARNLTLMAAIERGEGADDAVVRGWLTKALTASRGPQWCCDNCQHVHPSWQPVCTNCHAFDTLTWRTPALGEVAMPGGTEMLPLLVGEATEAEDLPVVVNPEGVDPESATSTTGEPEEAR